MLSHDGAQRGGTMGPTGAAPRWWMRHCCPLWKTSLWHCLPLFCALRAVQN